MADVSLTLGSNNYPLTLASTEFPLTLGSTEYPLTVVNGTELQLTLSGPTGPAGATGAAGPNTVSTSTTTSLNGYLYGNGTTVGGATSATSSATANTLALRDATGGANFAAVGATTVTASGVISTNGNSAHISTSGQFAPIYTLGADAWVRTSGQYAYIRTSGANAAIYTLGSDANIYTSGTDAYIQSRSTFKLFNGTYTTTLSHSPTANRAIAFPNAGGTIALTSDIPTVDATITDGSANAVAGNAVFDALALKAPLISPSFTTPTLGAATATTINNLGITAGANATLTMREYSSIFVDDGGYIQTSVNGPITTSIGGNISTGLFAPISTTAGGSFATGIGSLTGPAQNGTIALIDPSTGTQTFSGAQIFSSTTRPTSSGTGTPASNSLVTQQDVDESFLDFDTIALRDDFVGGQDGQLVLGQLDWERSQTNGTGNWRTMTPITGFGVGALFTAAFFKAAQSLQFDVSNVIGGGGFPLSLLANSSTRIKFRVQISSLNARIDIGFRQYIPASNQGFESRKLALNYTPVAASWTASTAIVIREFRSPTVANGRKYYASVGGTTGATEPTWPLTVGGTVTDGTVTWTEHGFEGGPNLRLVQHTAAGETAGVVVDTGIAAAIDTWYVVEGIWLSGSTWRFTVNGSAFDITTTGVLNGAMTPYFRIENIDAVANSLSIDYFGLFSRVTRP